MIVIDLCIDLITTLTAHREKTWFLLFFRKTKMLIFDFFWAFTDHFWWKIAKSDFFFTEVKNPFFLKKIGTCTTHGTTPIFNLTVLCMFLPIRHQGNTKHCWTFFFRLTYLWRILIATSWLYQYFFWTFVSFVRVVTKSNDGKAVWIPWEYFHIYFPFLFDPNKNHCAFYFD